MMTYEVNLSPSGSIKSVERIFMKFFIRNKRKEFCINGTAPLPRKKKRESNFARTTIPRLRI